MNMFGFRDYLILLCNTVTVSVGILDNNSNSNRAASNSLKSTLLWICHLNFQVERPEEEGSVEEDRSVKY